MTNPTAKKVSAAPQKPDSVPEASESKPLAAYRLGYHAQMVRVWFRVFLSMPGEEWGTWDGVPLSLDAIDKSRITLVNEIEKGTILEMRYASRKFRRLFEKVLRELNDPNAATSSAVGRGHIPGEQTWRDLRSLATDALRAASPLRIWCDLGSAIGRYRIALDAWREPNELPDFNPVLACCRRVPKQSRNAIPVIGQLVHLAKNSRKCDPLVIVSKAVNVPHRQIRDDQELPAHWLQQRLEKFSRLIEEALPAVNLDQSAHWDEKTDDRDEWIYEQCMSGRAYKAIIAALKGNPQSWERIESVNGIKAAANRYARRKGVLPPPTRQPGRPPCN